jgi:hypothetical protein
MNYWRCRESPKPANFLVLSKFEEFVMNLKKLLHSELASVEQRDRQKRFIVSRVSQDYSGNLQRCVLEAACHPREMGLNCRPLSDSTYRKVGWI